MKKTIMLMMVALVMVGLVTAGTTTIENLETNYDKDNGITHIEFDEVRNYSTGLPIFTYMVIQDHKEEVIGKYFLGPRLSFSRICIGTACICSGGSCEEPRFTPETCVSNSEYDEWINTECSLRFGRLYCPNGKPYKCSEVKTTIHRSIDIEMPEVSEIKGLGNLKLLAGKYYNETLSNIILEQRL